MDVIVFHRGSNNDDEEKKKKKGITTTKEEQERKKKRAEHLEALNKARDSYQVILPMYYRGRGYF